MLKPEDKIVVTNRSNGSVIYNIPEQNIRREFNVREKKTVPYSEIESVAAQNGGPELLYNYFYFENREVLTQALNIKPEIEYDLTEDKIPKWMVVCSLEEFQDALDYAPDGIKDLIKKFAVSLPLNDMEKREALLKQLKFDCTRAIENNREENKENVTEQKDRRVKDAEEEVKLSEDSEKPARRYNVVNKKDN